MCLGAYKVNKERTAGFPAWKRGLLAGVIGLAAVGAAAGIRDRQNEGGRAMVMGDASEEGAPSGNVAGENKDTETKKIALTFDDGPHPRYTEELLDGLAKRKVKATFFLLGQNIEGREEIIKRMAQEGHLIGNHTASPEGGMPGNYGYQRKDYGDYGTAGGVYPSPLWELGQGAGI